MYSRVRLQRSRWHVLSSVMESQRLLAHHPVPPGRIVSFNGIPGTSCLATLMRPSGTISRRPITKKSALMGASALG